jgi:DNA-binding NtrC family response regulator
VDLDKAVADGRFRRDLYYRLAAAVITTPPLRSRRSDIPLLIERILRDEAAGNGKCQLSAAAMAAVMEHSWPGNVRELKNVLRRAAALGGKVLEPEDLKLAPLPAPAPDPDSDEEQLRLIGQTFEQIEREVLLRTLRRCSGNQRAASQALAIPRSTLNDKLRRYGVETGMRRRGEK